MLDMEVRKDTEMVARATTQRNYAELFQQVALFEPGRKALLAEEKTVRLALEAVVAGSIWTDPQGEARTIIDQAKKSAENTLSLLYPPSKDGKEGKEISPEVRHLMMSCKSATLTKSILESCLSHGDVCVQINGTRSRLSSESSPNSSAGTTSSGLISSRCQRQTFFICVQTCR